MKTLLYLLLISVLIGCNQYDKKNNYKPLDNYSYMPDVACEGALFSIVFPSDARVIKLTDSTFAVVKKDTVRIYNDDGQKTDSLYLKSPLDYPLKTIPFWDESGFFVFSFPILYAYNAKFELLWSKNTGLYYQYPDEQVKASPDMGCLILEGTELYKITQNETKLVADLRLNVDKVLSYDYFDDGKIAFYALLKDYPYPYWDEYALFELTTAGAINKVGFSESTYLKNYLDASVNRSTNGNISLFISNNEGNFYVLNSDYYVTENWLIPDKYQLNNRPKIEVYPIGFGNTMVEYMYDYIILNPSTGGRNQIPYFSSPKLTKEYGSRPNCVPNTVMEMRNKKLLIACNLYMKSYYVGIGFNKSFTLVSLTDYNGQFCK